MWTFLRAINEQGTTIILTTHYLEEPKPLPKLAIIDGGRIIENDTMAASSASSPRNFRTEFPRRDPRRRLCFRATFRA